MRCLWPFVVLGLAACRQGSDDPASPEEEAGAFCADVPPTPVHRLTRTELDRALRDLLGVTEVPVDLLPVEERLGGFTNQTPARAVDDLWASQFAEVADRVARAAVGDIRQVHRIEVEDFPATKAWVEDLSATGEGTWVIFEHGAPGVAIPLELPAGGTWQLHLRALWWSGFVEFDTTIEPSRVMVVLDGDVLDEQPITGTWYNPRDLRVTFGAEAGAHTLELGLRFKGPAETIAGPSLLAFDFVELHGPLPDRSTRTPLAQAVDACVRAGGSEAACAGDVAVGVARRAWRGPVSTAEEAALRDLISLAVDEGDTVLAGLGAAVEAVVLSPRFVLQLEPGEGPVYRLGPHALAGRLASALWGSVPDEALLDCADAGALVPGGRDDCALEAQVARMLADPRAEVLIDGFGFEWLHLDTLPDLSRDPARFPMWDAALVASMLDETRQVLLRALQDGVPVRDLLRPGETWVDARLADFYGLDAPDGGAGFVPTDDRRGALLQHASVLAVTGTPTRTSPPIRGAYVLARFLCDPPDSPPAQIPALPDDAEEGAVRDVLEMHTKNPACAGCHAAIDPLGFGLERYDAIGAWRDAAPNGAPIEVSGTLDGTTFHTEAELVALLRDDPRFLACVAEKVLTWGLRRAPVDGDEALIDRLADQDTLGGMFESLVASPAFQCRAVE